MGPLNARLLQEPRVQLDVHLGIHAGQWSWARSGAGQSTNSWPLGETPNVAARLPGRGGAPYRSDQCRHRAALAASSPASR